MRCLDVRLRLESYLSGKLEVEETEVVNGHLLACPPCREYMLKCGMIERIEPGPESLPSPGFSDRVLDAVSPRWALRPLTKLFIGVSTAAFLFALTVFTYLRYYLNPDDLAEIPRAELLGSPAHWFDSLSGLAATPLLRYALYAGGAVLLAVVLIVVVDMGSGSAELPNAKARSSAAGR
ncbi:MAG: zf-HC2 domain-containing protein [bacterium]